MRVEHDPRGVTGHTLAVDVGVQPLAIAGAEAADAVRGEADAPDGEELAERVHGLGGRLDVDDPARVVGVERVEVALLLVDPISAGTITGRPFTYRSRCSWRWRTSPSVSSRGRPSASRRAPRRACSAGQGGGPLWSPARPAWFDTAGPSL